MVGWVVGWVGGWLAGWLAGWVAGWLGGWVAGWLGGWVAGWLGGWVAWWLGGWVGGLLGWVGWLVGCWATKPTATKVAQLNPMGTTIYATLSLHFHSGQQIELRHQSPVVAFSNYASPRFSTLATVFGNSASLKPVTNKCHDAESGFREGATITLRRSLNMEALPLSVLLKT